MEIWQLKYFIQVYNENSFSKAADNLHISQQGLSKIVKKLENELGLILFERSSRGVKPTKFGKLLFEQSQDTLKEFDLLMDNLHDMVKSQKEIISLGMPHCLCTKYFATMIWKFKEAYPDIRVEIVELDSYSCEKYIENKLLDLSFVINYANIQKFNFNSLFSSGMALLTSKDNLISKNSSVNFIDLKNEEFVMMHSEYKLHQLILEQCNKAGFKPNIFYNTSQIDLIIELVALNKGITVLPEPDVLRAVKNNDMVSIVPFEKSPFKMEIGLIVNKYHNLNNKIDILTDYVIKYLKSNEVY